jgi:hypothetical protein
VRELRAQDPLGERVPRVEQQARGALGASRTTTRDVSSSPRPSALAATGRCSASSTSTSISEVRETSAPGHRCGRSAQIDVIGRTPLVSGTTGPPAERL